MNIHTVHKHIALFLALSVCVGVVPPAVFAQEEGGDSALSSDVVPSVSEQEDFSSGETIPIIEQSEEPQRDAQDIQSSASLPEETQSRLSFDGGASRTIQTTPESLQKLPHTDLSTGALLYRYDFTLPPGRNGMTPDISLVYNSNEKNTESIAGFGWSFAIPSITRINKHGSDDLYEHNDFSSSFDGELKQTDGNIYNPRSGGSESLSYTFDGEGWTVYDKTGTRYLFGATAEARQDDPADSTRVYRWMLEEVRDTDGNTIRYEYVKDAGQIYPDRVLYAENNTSEGVFEVVFTREATGTLNTELFYPAFSVRNNFRISNVEVRMNDEWVRRYVFTYSDADVAGYRRLLSSIAEHARDEISGDIIVDNPTVFTYKKSEPITWTQTDNTWLVAKYFYDDESNDPTLLELKDINGDAYPDTLVFEKDSDHCQSSTKANYINNAHGGWISYGGCNVAWDLPVFLKGKTPPYPDYGTRIFDYNGDMMNDVVRSLSENLGGPVTAWETYKNTGDPTMGDFGWVSDPSVAPPLGFVFGNNLRADNAVRIVDVNGDGLQDILHAFLDDDGNGLLQQAYLNTGAGWEPAEEGEWDVPFPFVDENPSGKEVFTFAQIADLNGDSLPDIFWRYEDNEYWWGASERTYINNGHGWNENDGNKWWTPRPFQGDDYASAARSDEAARITDLNGDGLIDIIRRKPTLAGAFLNTGSERQTESFSSVPQVSAPEPFALNNEKTQHVMLVDINADGMDDIVYGIRNDDEQDIKRTYLAQGTPFTDMLVGIETPEGAVSEIAYKLSTQYFDEDNTLLNPKLPIAVTTVESITTNPIPGEPITRTYTYADGFFYYNNAHDRQFAGFGTVTTTDGEGNITTTYYHQGNDTREELGEHDDHIAKAGRVWREEIYDADRNLQQVTINTWEHFPLSTEAHFVGLTNTITLSYDGTTTHRDSAESFTYDTFGNVTEHTMWGEVEAAEDGTFTDIGDDKRIAETTYALNENAYIVALPQSQVLTNQSGEIESETRSVYDNLSPGEVAVGNLTKEARRIDESTWAETERDYTTFGLVSHERDPEGNETTYTYDSHMLYPETVTNALGHQTHHTYDYSSGQIVQTTDPNDFIHQTHYDGLDRPLEEHHSEESNPSSLALHTRYTYDDSSTPRHILKQTHLDDTTTAEMHTYTDGLGRIIQERTEAEEAATFSVHDMHYDERGLVKKESLPYFSLGYAFTPATTTEALFTTYTYDALERPQTITHVRGTTNYAYDQWSTTITDTENNTKIFTHDAFGNLVQVDEHNEGDTYSTHYTYDTLNNLITIADAEENTRSFTYDMLGRRLTAEDLHDPSDSTFGTWSFTYDRAGNLIDETQPTGDTIAYTYDALNRLTKENFDGAPGTEATHTYDTCTGGIGRRCTMQNEAVSENFTYDSLGLLKEETKEIDGTSYTTTFTHDRQGNPASITYPNGDAVVYTYNTAGLLENVTHNGTPVVNAIDYAPTGQVSRRALANNVESTYVYDVGEMWRLRGITTQTTQAEQEVTGRRWNTRSVSPTLQNTTYTHSPEGNITHITDTSSTQTAKTATYTYDDLYRLTNAHAEDASGTLYNETYTYTPLGNIIDKNGTAYTYSNTGHTNPHAATTIGEDALTYDENGNLTRFGDKTFTWDYKNRLTGALENGETTTYTYNPLGARVTKESGGETTHYINNFYDVEGTTPRVHIYAGDQRVATHTLVPEETSEEEATFTYNTTPSTPTEETTSPETQTQTTTTPTANLTLSLDTTENTTERTPNTHTLTHTLHYRNHGPDHAQNVVITIPYNPLRSTPIQSSLPAICQDSGTTITCTIPTLPLLAGNNPLTYHTTLQGDEPLSFTASITSDTPDPTPEDNTTTETITPTPTPIEPPTLIPGYVYYHTDHLGSVVLTTDENGNVVQVLDYYPYGSLRIDQTTSFDSSRKFTGHEFDRDTDLTYAGARYYDQDVGRFLSQDPMFLNIGSDKRTQKVLSDPQLANSYSYARNSPVLNVDQNGEEPIKSQLGTTQSFERLLQHVDKIYGGDSRGKQLNAVRQYVSDNPSRYIYTTEKGWIDAQHFFGAAEATQLAPGFLVRIGGFFFEAGQPLLGAEKSSFSYEDLPSNKAGTEFGKLIRGNENSLSELYKNYISSIGATVPTDAPNFDTISDTTRVRVEGTNFSSDPIKKQDNTKK